MTDVAPTLWDEILDFLVEAPHQNKSLRFKPRLLYKHAPVSC